MTQFTQNTAMPSSLWQYWRGLSGWNFYFLVKFGLLWAGYLNFHPLLNLVFAAFLLMPIPRYSLHRLRHWVSRLFLSGLGSRLAPVILSGAYLQRAGVFSLQQPMPPGIKPPQHCASPEPFRLAADFTIVFCRQHPAIFLIA